MKPNIIKQVGSYVAAEASKIIEGDLPLPVQEIRKEACKTCEHLVNPDLDEIGWCGACGCGHNRRARLSLKITMPLVSCPKKKWGEADAKSPYFRELVDSLRKSND